MTANSKAGGTTGPMTDSMGNVRVDTPADQIVLVLLLVEEIVGADREQEREYGDDRRTELAHAAVGRRVGGLGGCFVALAHGSLPVADAERGVRGSGEVLTACVATAVSRIGVAPMLLVTLLYFDEAPLFLTRAFDGVPHHAVWLD